MEDGKYCKVCVTGGSGYIGSYLIKKLLDKGTYFVHATLRNLGDSAKVGLLKSLRGAETRLKLFEADIYNPEMFEPALQDCTFVFHVATPLMHTHNSKFKDTTEAAVAGVRSIAMSCIRSGTVRRLIYTASVVSASALSKEGTSFAEYIDESCWTPVDMPLSFAQEHEQNYATSKTEAEKEILRFGESGNLEVVSLTLGLVGGETLLPYIPGSVAVFLSQLKDEESIVFRQLRFIEEICGKIPSIHIEDTCDAHIFCIEKDSINGRFLCASDFVSSADIAEYYQQKFPELAIKQGYLGEPRKVKWGSTKLVDEGFKYKYDLKTILDDSVECARRLNAI
ncbi:NADPH HC-toxin reductase 1-like [Silene latifolia]|uniref:NADPH HC-toxin reductase 1-like n=1 Tax=Silene latifolia TaxID=37657 RepID=UPI003D77AF0C